MDRHAEPLHHGRQPAHELPRMDRRTMRRERCSEHLGRPHLRRDLVRRQELQIARPPLARRIDLGPRSCELRAGPGQHHGAALVVVTVDPLGGADQPDPPPRCPFWVSRGPPPGRRRPPPPLPPPPPPPGPPRPPPPAPPPAAPPAAATPRGTAPTPPRRSVPTPRSLQSAPRVRRCAA